MTLPAQPPSGVHNTTPAVASASRIYDFFLGGQENYTVDQAAASFALRAFPWTGRLAKYNRYFLQRLVRYMLQQGITQFLDLGSGLPTLGNVHEVARSAGSDARVVYVDYESYAVDRGRQVLADDPHATIIAADITRPQEILEHPEVADLLDLKEPIGFLVVSVLHFVAPAAKPYEFVETYKKALAPGSVMGVSHGSYDGTIPRLREQMAELQRAYDFNVAENAYSRSQAEIIAFAHGWDMVEPGCVLMPDWHPDEPAYEPDENDDARLLMHAFAARKP